ncbi:hypothetical protein V2G26_009829 [Clonostachys chloroleuca]
MHQQISDVLGSLREPTQTWLTQIYTCLRAYLRAYDALLTVASFYVLGRGMTDIIALKGEVDDVEAIPKGIPSSVIGQTILVVKPATPRHRSPSSCSGSDPIAETKSPYRFLNSFSATL